MLTVALTGGIGAGKSTALTAFKELGAHIFELDAIARDILEPDSPTFGEVARLWPSVIDDGQVNRQALAAIVFADEAARVQLEALVHPQTWRELDRRLTEVAMTDPRAIAVFELALLVGSPRQDSAHFNLGIEAAPDVRITRLEGERGMSPAQAQARMDHQHSDEATAAICDAVILNNGDIEALKRQIETLWAGRLLPYAENLALGARIHSANTPACGGSHEIARACARLAAHGIVSVQAEGDNLLLTSPADAQLLARAGFVPADDGYVSADPAVKILLRTPA